MLCYKHPSGRREVLPTQREGRQYWAASCHVHMASCKMADVMAAFVAE